MGFLPAKWSYIFASLAAREPAASLNVENARRPADFAAGVQSTRDANFEWRLSNTVIYRRVQGFHKEILRKPKRNEQGGGTSHPFFLPWRGFLAAGVLPVPPEESSSVHSPYGTQIFLTWYACSKYQGPPPCAALKKSISRPSLVQTCFRLPIESALAIVQAVSSP